jgi:hypothetical protein
MSVFPDNLDGGKGVTQADKDAVARRQRAQTVLLR